MGAFPRQGTPANETVSQLPFCHSVQAKRDTESSIISKFWIPAFASMTTLMAIPAIATQSRMLGMLGRNDIIAGFIQFCKARPLHNHHLNFPDPDLPQNEGLGTINPWIPLKFLGG